MSGLLARAADFQAAWYFSIILVAISVAVGIGARAVAREVRRLWRDGDRGTAVWVGAATAVGVLFMISMAGTVMVGFILQSRGSS